jgi:catechol 2,3-dioxygenase-like lactoylglutathione lyase family enzyme
MPSDAHFDAKRALGLVALVVRDYDEALAFFVGILDFVLIEDTEVPAQGKRWVVVSPGRSGARLLLAKASSDAQLQRVGDQTGGRVSFFLYTDDCARDHAKFVARGVKFVRQPQQQHHGLVAVFEDLHGNRWDLIQPNQDNRSWQW